MQVSIVIVSLMFVASCTAHLCLISPHQRGSMAMLNKPGASDCLLIQDAPCGGRSKEMPSAILRRGMNTSVIFQKNLSHWNKAIAGHFSVTLWASTSGSMEVASIMDSVSPSLTLYTSTFMVGTSLPTGPAVIQVQYVTDNPNAPAVFYQCADVTIE